MPIAELLARDRWDTETQGPPPTTDLYFECHVTIEPETDEDRLLLQHGIARRHGFRAATFLLKKGSTQTPDDFLTTRGVDFIDVQERMNACVDELTREGFPVVRWKIENTLTDVRVPRQET